MTTALPPINADQLLETFLAMVRIDSPSGDETAMRLWLESWFTQRALPCEIDPPGNLIVKIPGTRPGGKPLVITGHMDVVPPCHGVKPQVEGAGDDRVIRSDGSTVLGGDDKSGLAPLLEALDISLANKLPRPDLLLLITVEEEVSLMGARKMDPAVYRDAAFGIAIDHTGEQGTVIHEAPTYETFKATVHGKSVHAGIAPEHGVNAIQLLARAMSKLPFGRLDADTTANMAFVRGGKATNIVPDLAVVEGEIRSHHHARVADVLREIETALRETTGPVAGARYELEHETTFRHYLTPVDHPGVQTVIRAVEATGLPVNLIRTNGGSDINVFAENGLPGVVLSAGYVAPHALAEHVALRDMVTCTRLLLNIWEAFAA